MILDVKSGSFVADSFDRFQGAFCDGTASFVEPRKKVVDVGIGFHVRVGIGVRDVIDVHVVIVLRFKRVIPNLKHVF
jgi:hypothetical protein